MFCSSIDRKLFNVIFLGVCFMLLFAADYTVTNMQKTLIVSIHEENPDFNIDGYTSLGITYTIFALALWFGPSVVSVTGPKYGMAIAAVGYTIYILAFNLEKAWAIYAVTVIGGIAGGILWTAEGNYLVLNSDAKNITRNVGIFWAFLQSSSLLGNLFTFYKFEGKARIDGETRRQVIYVLGAVAALSILSFLLLPNSNSKRSAGKNNVLSNTGPLYELKKTWSVFITKDMLILNIMFCYTGLQHAFTYGVYSPSVGFTNAFGNQAKQLLALSGIFIAVGEVLGALCQVWLSKRIVHIKQNRSIVIIFGFFLQITAYCITYINLPNTSVFGETGEKALIKPNAILAILCSLLLGCGDSCLNTQNFSIIAVLFPKDSAQSCALYKFNKSFLVAVGFFASSHFGLHTQLLILAPAALIGVLSFYYVDNNITKRAVTKDWSSADEEL
uniref:UNC93-like protein MFSD11 n=1 Tax=Clastoptera arizonana TaxID=38151 RepID=A0A1B6CC64_9HEMI